MPEWSTACPDWQDRLTAGRSIIPAPIYPDEAARALAIFKELRVVDLPGKPTFGECSAPWVFDFVAAIFGAYDAETGRQLVREFYLLISKKNTKSTIAAGIMLTAAIMCWREDEEHLILAPTKEIADNSFKPAAGMVRADEELSSIFHIQEHVRTITHRVTRASLKVVAADTETVSGKKSGRVLIDEHWLFGKKINAAAMFQEATGGQISREEGWVIYLSTQSDEPPSGVFKEKLDFYRDIRDGKIVSPKHLGVLYEFPAEMVKAKAYLEPANYYLTNPNIGRSVSQEWIADKLLELNGKTDGSLQTFLAKHLNIEIGMSLRADRWAGADFWEQQADPAITLDELLRRCEVIAVGIDGGGLDDMLGFAVIGRVVGSEGERAQWLVWTRAWINRVVLQRRKSEAARFADFAADGDLIICEEVGQDVEEVSALVAAIERSGLLDKVGIDPAGIGGLLDGMIAAGVPEDKIAGISQGWRLGGAIKTAERKLAEGRMLHHGSRLMDWCVGNAKVEPRGNAILITKQASGSAKIDPLMATFNAVSLMALNPAGAGKSFWESETA
jgi:phage terminase large subunit-like protein